MTSGDKLALARKYQSPALTQRDLAERLGIDTSSVGRWEATGKVPASRLDEVARILDIKREWFLDGLEGPPAFLHLPNTVELSASAQGVEATSLVRGDEVLLPTWRGVIAGDGECEFFPGESVEFSSVPSFLAGNHPDDHILCIASGRSMFPRVKNSEKVVVRLDRNPPNNAIVIALRPDGANFIKVLRQDTHGMLQLHSLNPEFSPILELNQWEMRGYAVAILHDYEPGQANIEWDQGRALRA